MESLGHVLYAFVNGKLAGNYLLFIKLKSLIILRELAGNIFVMYFPLLLNCSLLTRILMFVMLILLVVL